MPGEHSILAPLSAPIWVPCPGSIQQCLVLPPQVDDQDADEGNAVHAIGADFVRGSTKAQGYKETAAAMIGTVRDGVTITKEMIEGAILYAGTCTDLMRSTGVFGGPNLGIEQLVTIEGVHADCYGTPDFFLFDSHESILYVADLKYGFGIHEVFENWQLLAYAIGVVAGITQKPATIKLMIIQPRAPHARGPVRTWKLTRGTLNTTYRNQLIDAAETAIGSDAFVETGDHCRRCDALISCEFAQRCAFNALDMAGGLGSYIVPEGDQWYELFLLEKAQKRIDHRVDALRTVLETKLKKGANVPRFRLADTFGRPAWNISHAEIIQLGKSYGLDLNVSKTLTPTQAKKEGLSADLADAFTERKKTGSKLVYDDLKNARYLFGDAAKE